MELNKGQIIYIIVYEPTITINIYEIKDKFNFSLLPNEDAYSLFPIIEDSNNLKISHLGKDRIIWVEKTLNLNKVIKYKKEHYFISINEKLIVERFKTLLKYQQKLNESKTEYSNKL